MAGDRARGLVLAELCNAPSVAFLAEAATGASSETALPASVRLETRQAENAFYFETRRKDGAFVHRSYLAKQ